MTNNLHHLRAGIKTFFFILGLGYHQIQIIELEFVQHRGNQIRVNTWTGSYTGCLQENYRLLGWKYYIKRFTKLIFDSAETLFL